MKLQMVHWVKPHKGIKAEVKCEACNQKQTMLFDTHDYNEMASRIFRTPCDCGHQTLRGKQ